MSLDVRVILISEFLRTDVAGVLDVAASYELLRTLVASASQHGVDRMLIDGRSARSEASTSDIWNLAADLPALGVSREHRLAFLVEPPPDQPFDRGAFLELCATNRGYQLRAFRDFEQAFTWLTG